VARVALPFALAFALLGAMAGCAADTGAPGLAADDAHVGTVRQGVIDGDASPSSQDMVVQIALAGPDGLSPLCTGSLVAKNLVLTARHCVGEHDPKGDTVANFEASTLRVYTGAGAPKKIADGERAVARGKKIFCADTTSLFPDVALLLLDASVPSAKIAPVRIEGGAKSGERIKVVGYGLTEKGTTPSGRLQRAVTVEHVFPYEDATAGTLHEGEFLLGEAACSGDSGGPALHAASGAVLGVASRVGGGMRRASGDASFCVGPAAVGVYTGLEAASEFLDAAFEAAGASPTSEDATRLASAGDAQREPAPLAMPSSGCQAANAHGAEGSPPRERALLIGATALALGARRRRRRA
jgi:hypothetical protein